ncbi:HAD-like domain-containing protein [Mycotypha africana]|uniref:HAD-like domain-containing protein n=1 Tax=Mycotypha africana TaxID=64632 RepID=UPI002301FDE7|nr:HAD-like domain-containing protein [Mycotypha africana]KAI8973249.1 HAD-like domain-containing protein [Mycotypha africana]
MILLKNSSRSLLNVFAKSVSKQRRFTTVQPSYTTTNYAFAFDIDGVLIKGKKPIPEATRALKLLNGDNPVKRRIPYVLLTNGGGVTEEEKAKQISDLLGVEINPDQVILSHSPMKSLAKQYESKKVLVVGGKARNCAEVAKRYGFKEAVTPHDIMCWNSSVSPYSLPKPEYFGEKTYNFSKEPIHAVFVFNDSFDLGRDVQIMLDVLCSKDGIVGTRKDTYEAQEIPLYWSCNDLIWSTDFPAPRLGQGAMKITLEALYKELTKRPLNSISFGKPHAVTYRFAEKILPRNVKRIYAIGDNPAADIKGANANGWISCLVRTGVFTGPKHNAEDYPAHIVCNHVEEAVSKIIENEENNIDFPGVMFEEKQSKTHQPITA